MKVLVFGASGSIGGEIVKHFEKIGHFVVPVFRSEPKNSTQYQNAIIADVLMGQNEEIDKYSNYDAVIFAQGMNFNDSILDFATETNLEMYKSNCLFIMQAMNFLLENNLLNNKANVVVVSSIWQNIARKNKLSYCVTKSAIAGLVRSLSVDLASYNNGNQCFVNAVLPGATETPMTLKNLSQSQIEALKNQTPAGKLAKLEDVVQAVEFLAKTDGITGQMINVDYGFNYAKIF